MKERLKTAMGNVVFSLKVSFLASKKYFLLKCLILLSNTIGADRILVLKDGRIIEQGPHHALLKQGGEYARLFHLQADKYS